MMRTHLTEDALGPALLFVVFGSVLLCMPPHNDTWWHLRSGLEMHATGSIVLTERLSHTAHGLPLYHNHEWLTQLLFHGLYTLGGAPLLALVCASCVMAAVVSAWRLSEGSADTRFACLLLLVAGTAIGWAIRPQVVSLLLFVLSIRLATTDRAHWLPVLCMAWANLHAVSLTGVVIAGCAAVDSILWDRARARRSIGIFLACAAAPMLTPLGWHYWPRVLEVVRIARTLGINEYRSAFEVGMLPFWACVTTFVVLVARSGPERLQSRRTRVLVVVGFVFAVAGALSIRNVPLFLLAAVPAMSRLCQPGSRRENRKPMPATALLLAALVAVTAVAGVAYAWRDRGARLGWRPIRPAAVAAIRRCEGPLFNGFADGGALTWFIPDRKIFVDSRGIEAYPLELLVRSRDADLHGQYRELFDDFDIRCAVVGSGSVMALALAADPEMREVYADTTWQVFSHLAPKRHRSAAQWGAGGGRAGS